MPYVVMAAQSEGARKSIVGACATPQLAVERAAEVLRQGMSDIIISDESSTLYTVAEFRKRFLSENKPES